MLQKGEDFDLLQIIEEGVKQGCLIHGIDHVHLTVMEEVICDLGIITLSSVPEEAVTEGFLELVAGGHGRRLSTKPGGCQVRVWPICQ